MTRSKEDLRAKIAKWNMTTLVQAAAVDVSAAMSPYNHGPLQVQWPGLGILTRREFPIVMELASEELNRRFPVP